VELGTEAEVTGAFVRWLESSGWSVQEQLDWADVVATRSGERLIAEVKGATASPGLDVDTLYGQLLRRMVPEDDVRYGVVVPLSVAEKATRVPEFVRALLKLDVYGVGMDDSVSFL
jgi:hypothetical protein